MGDKDSDLDSFLTTSSQRRVLGRKKKTSKRIVSLQQLQKSQTMAMQGLASQREAMRNDMLLQCKVNECQYSGLVDKKKRARQIEAEVLGMTQEVMLMQKQIQRRARKANELKQRSTMTQQFQDVRQHWVKKKTKHKEDLNAQNLEQVKKGVKLRHMSQMNKEKLAEQLKEEKYRMYLELKERAKRDEMRKNEDTGSVANQKFLKAKENKIAEEKGNITKKDYTKSKINELSSQIRNKLKVKDKDVEKLKHSMIDLVRSHGAMRKQLEQVDLELSRERERAKKLKIVNDYEEKLFQKPSYTYKFDKFSEKARMAQFLLEEDRRKQKAVNKETEFVKRNMEMSLRMYDSLPMLEKNKLSTRKEISHKF